MVIARTSEFEHIIYNTMLYYAMLYNTIGAPLAKGGSVGRRLVSEDRPQASLARGPVGWP
eukprot:7146018-Heterocapsa_arctica.AAC.1